MLIEAVLADKLDSVSSFNTMYAQKKHQHKSNLADRIVYYTDYFIVTSKNLAENLAEILLKSDLFFASEHDFA